MPHSPTRFPYGVSFVKPGANSTEYVLESGATPDVSFGTYFIRSESSNTISNFEGGERGKVIFLKCSTGSVVIIQNSAGGIRLTNIVGTTSAGSTVSFTTGGNITMLNGETIGFMHDGTDWQMLGTRFVLSTQI